MIDMYLIALVAIALGRGAAAQPRITVFAAASLAETLDDIARAYEEGSGQEVRIQTDASSRLARQIALGASADVFVTADPAWLRAVRPLDRYDWLGNRLVLVVPSDAPDVDLPKLESLALASEGVPAGTYARAALACLGIPLPRRTVLGESVRDVLRAVSHGGAEAGIVYATDAAVDPGVRIAYHFPADSHPRIVYAVALLTKAGRPFFEALREPSAVATAERRGFSALAR